MDILELILKNKTICFNNLLNVDDVEETKTNDMGDFGKYIYVSCWNLSSEESIPLWSMYTQDMHGVRIGMPKMPFKKYHYRVGKFGFTEELDSCINYNDKLLQKCSIIANNPILESVKYTDNENELFPIVRKESYLGAAVDYMNASAVEKVGNAEISYSFETLGKCKRKEWEFQNECRYIIHVWPMGIGGFSKGSFELHQEFVRRMEDRNNEPPVDKIFLSLDEFCFDNMEIVLGPKMNEFDKNKVDKLLEEYAPNSVCRDSNLKIRMPQK